MEKIKVLCLCLTAVVICTSCGGGEYVEHEGTICYTYWTFSFGRLYRELPKVNPATFQSVKNWLGHDSIHVYFEEYLVPDVDIATLKVKKYPLFLDKNDYYYKGVPMHVADKQTFKVLKYIDDDLWAKDSQFAYFDSIRIEEVDVKSFRIISSFAAVDNKHVYRFGKMLPLADPATYRELENVYSKDKSHVWYGDRLLEDADAATFTVDRDGYGVDKYGRFTFDKRE